MENEIEYLMTLSLKELRRRQVINELQTGAALKMRRPDVADELNRRYAVLSAVIGEKFC